MIDLILSLIPGQWGAYAGVAIGAVLSALALWFGGRKSAKQDAKVDDLEEYQKTRERIDDAANDIHGDDPAAARRFLLERGKR